ncbi:hypothetical protein CANARDRAFT_176460 [[Candida] arabinofermentans NRRL YB-2248]|uniref:Uncharacterized protein n=1 Tax=[Candida] arabinofermentans NRRL YB-2248 TaxID=983967 RepID=A0A1E4SZZ8_9ASCO|nr:hypothetical protein CANARDRAFT_176460 [[Candida] arabinofermentans NRRL YB-2248]
MIPTIIDQDLPSLDVVNLIDFNFSSIGLGGDNLNNVQDPTEIPPTQQVADDSNQSSLQPLTVYY